jgi:hypothetical protein
VITLFQVSSASNGPSWELIFLGGLGGAIILLAVPALSKWIRITRLQARKRRDAKYEAEVLARKALEKRFEGLADESAELKKSMARVLTFIEGTRDPFTGEMQGGLVKTLRQILDLVDPPKDVKR